MNGTVDRMEAAKMVNLSQLRAFDAAVRCGSFTAAADRLSISQPAVTAHVRGLEEYYQVRLFRRRGRQVAPTPMGERLARVTLQLFALADEAEDLLRSTKALKDGYLSVAAGSPYFAVPLLAAFRARHPGVRISLTIGNSSEVLDALLAERCDLAVQSELADHPDVHAVSCGHHQVVAVVGPEHPWAVSGLRSIRLAEIDGEALIMREPASTTRHTFEAACAGAGIRPRIGLEIANREAVKEAVAAGLGIGIIAEAELGRDDRLYPLRIDDAEMTNREYVMSLKRRQRLSPIRAFFAVARETLPHHPALTSREGDREA